MPVLLVLGIAALGFLLDIAGASKPFALLALVVDGFFADALEALLLDFFGARAIVSVLAFLTLGALDVLAGAGSPEGVWIVVEEMMEPAGEAERDVLAERGGEFAIRFGGIISVLFMYHETVYCDEYHKISP